MTELHLRINQWLVDHQGALDAALGSLIYEATATCFQKQPDADADAVYQTVLMWVGVAMLNHDLHQLRAGVIRKTLIALADFLEVDWRKYSRKAEES